ncbi:MAG: YIP1 family protein [bacterium]
MTIGQKWWGIIAYPDQFMETLCNSGSVRESLAFAAFNISVSSVLLAISAIPTLKIWGAILYFIRNTVLGMVLILVTSLIFHGVSRILRGRGTLRATIAALSYATAITLIISIFASLTPIFNNIVFVTLIIYIWWVVVISKGIGIAHKRGQNWGFGVWAISMAISIGIWGALLIYNNGIVVALIPQIKPLYDYLVEILGI